MDFSFTPAQEDFRAEVRAWLEANRPAADIGDWPSLREWHRTLHDGGWAAIAWPREYGGRGAALADQIIFNQELARLGLPIGCNPLGIIMAGPALIQWGTDEQKRRFIPPILSGDEIWCEGLSEPGTGSDLAAIETRATADGEFLIVNGHKVWTTLAHRADYCQLFVRINPAAPRHRGLGCVLVDMHSAGVTVRPLRQMSGDSEFNEIFFDDVRVPRANLLGPADGGWAVLMSTLMHERIGIGETIGGVDRTLADLVELARIEAPDGSRMKNDPAVRNQLAQFAIEAAARRYNGMRSLTRRLKGQPPGPEASVSKLVATELTQRMVRAAATMIGLYTVLDAGSPFAPDGDWARRILRAESLTIAGGTSAVQRNMIGERMLGLPRN